MTVKVRFAPSPTGKLHIGNVRAAVLNWAFARKHGGQFLLRLDDTDTERSTEAFARAIEDDLAWLGIGWDRFTRQSDRLEQYAAAAARLRATGRLYPCYETAEELDLKRKVQLSRRLPPVYDRSALSLTTEDRSRLEAEGRKPHWRFRLEPGLTVWDDLIHGHTEIDAGSLSDPVLLRADGRPLYTLSSVVDDGELGITHVIRGEDHITNTAAQIQLFRALGFPPPVFAHFSMLVGADGAGLSKRLGSLGIADFRAQGIEPLTICCFLVRLGSADPIEAHPLLEDLLPGFDIGRFGRAPAHFDPLDLLHLNAKLLHLLPFLAVQDRLPDGATEDFWLAVRGNITVLAEAADWWQVVRGPIVPVMEDPRITQAAAAALPPEPWDGTTWKAITQAVSTMTNARGRALFHPLRLALTGRDRGPEMQALLPLIGRTRSLSRLRGDDHV